MSDTATVCAAGDVRAATAVPAVAAIFAVTAAAAAD
jgi:hypothetical protein